MIKRLRWLAFLPLSAWISWAQASIDRVDPPNWWVGMAESRLQLMLYGTDIASYSVTSDSPALTIAAVTRGDSSNYLFVDLLIADHATAGDHPLTLTSADSEALTLNYRLSRRAPDSADREGFSARDAVYLIVPDRFSNADADNDEVEGLHEGMDWQHPYGRHGGDLQGIIEHLDYIERLGMTQIWMTPILENNQRDSSYHGYAATDLYRVDPRFGSNDDYRELVASAAKKGIGVIHDFVPNHIGSEHPWMMDLPSHDWVNHGGQYAPTNHRREAHQDPYASRTDTLDMTSGWFVPTMPDLNHGNPMVSTYLIQNVIWWIETTGLSGLRVDTWPYNDKPFLREFTDRVLSEYPGLSIVGEEWSLNPAIVAYWQRGKENPDGYNSGAPQMMDFPLQAAIREAVTEEENWNTGLVKLYQTLANDFLYADPMNLMLIADNHDMGRLYHGVGEDLDRYKMAMIFLATTRGIPQMLYGTELAMSNPANESHGLIRSDFPGGWPNDRVNAFSGRGLEGDAKDAQEFIRKLFTWRKSASAIHTGKLLHFAPKNGIYVYFRTNEEQRVMVVMNNGSNDMHLDSSQYAEGVGDATAAINVMSGARHNLAGRLLIPAKTAQVFELR